LLFIKRVDLRTLYDETLNLILNYKSPESIYSKFSDEERLFYFKSFMQAGKFDDELIQKILNDHYSLIRLLLIKYSGKLNMNFDILSPLLTDKSKVIRAGAIKLVQKLNKDEFRSILEGLIFDSSLPVRYESRNLLDKIGSYDFYVIYMTNIKDSKKMYGSILGLSEVGSKEDIPFILEYLESDIAKLRTASLTGIYNLDKERALELSYGMIKEPNPISTKKEAERILSKQGVDINRIREIFDVTDTIGKKCILRLINRFCGWSGAGDFLKAMVFGDDELKLMSKEFLKRWELYTMRLGTEQTLADKAYVMEWYNKAKSMGIQVSNNIPFIFGMK
jgi:hypothetical protein